MAVQTCKRCEAEKPAADFYANDRTCKECRKALVRANRLEKREQYREYEKARAVLPHRVAARAAYAETSRGRERSSSAKRAYIERNPERRRAHIALSNALRAGRVWKSPCCMAPGCFNTKRLHGHHTHYDAPLSVVWLCHSCHAAVHKQFNEIIL